MIFVRRARPDDWRELKALRLRALATDPGAFGSTLAREEAFDDAAWQERARSHVLVAVRASEASADGGRAEGSASSDWEGTCTLLWSHEPEIVGLWVAPEARGLGAGAMLLEAACADARSAGGSLVHLWSNADNAPAMALYRRVGFAPVGEPFLAPDGRRFQRLDRRLTET